MLSNLHIDGTVVFRSGRTRYRLKFSEIAAQQADTHSVVELCPSLTEADGNRRFSLVLTAREPVIIESLVCEINLLEKGDELVLLNGYQSWTDTAEFSRRDKLRRQSRLLYPLLAPHKLARYGDYDFNHAPARRGHLHGVSYGYVRRPENSTVKFFGSLNERSGFTFFYARIGRGHFSVRKDCEDLQIHGAYQGLDLFFSEGSAIEVMDRWFTALGTELPPARAATGWTSWYNYYRNISEDIILGNLKALKTADLPIDFFQINDGYQSAVGDWLSANERFPGGMKALATAIHEQGFKAGLWLAPFAAETTSALFRTHPDWFIKGKDGRPFSTGGNWSTFYSLDIYHSEARAYLKKVFDTVLNDWGYDLVKLDFLYGACILPRANKTRGQIMCEAMDLLRECCGTKLILGCGVPLWPAFGKVEYCRVGTDIDLQWHNKLRGALLHREYPSTRFALRNSIWRHLLDGRAFINDPDVFLLRHTNIKLSAEQRRTVLYINAIFGNLLFTSDDIREYSPSEHRLLRSIFPFVRKHISAFSCENDLYTADFSCGALDYRLYSNHSAKPRILRTPDFLCFRSGRGNSVSEHWLTPRSTLTIAPYATECLLRCERDRPFSIIGSSATAIAGTEVLSLSGSGSTVELTLHSNSRAQGELYLAAPFDANSIDCNGVNYPVKETSAGEITVRYVAIPVG